MCGAPVLWIVVGPQPMTRRVIEPPHGYVRALPPHAITAEGVGPFKLSMAMSEIAASLPPGSRMSLLQIPGVVAVPATSLAVR